MATFKFRRIRSKIYTSWTHNGHVLKLSTGISVHENDWDGNRVKRTDCQYESKNAILDSKIRDLMTATLNLNARGELISAANIRDEYHRIQGSEMKPANEANDLSEFWSRYEEYYDSKLSLRRERTLAGLKQTKELMKEFERHSRWNWNAESFNHVQFSKYIQFMLGTKNYQDSTIDKHLRAVRSFFKWGYPKLDRSFMQYLWKTNDEIIALTEDELFKLRDAELVGYQKKSRDLFIFSAYTGMRYSDTQRFRRDWIQDGVIDFRMLKTGGRAIVPVFPEVEDIINQYAGFAPTLSQQRQNKFIKEVCKTLKLQRAVKISRYQGSKVFEESVPLHEAVTTHTARKTFISLALKKGVPLQDVMHMSGHDDYQSMRPYISISREHIRQIGNNFQL